MSLSPYSSPEQAANWAGRYPLPKKSSHLKTIFAVVLMAFLILCYFDCQRWM